MGSKEIAVTFETITPLWTGDAWQNNSEIRSSSLIGSLRFWFAFYWNIVKNGTTEKLDENGIPRESLSELESSKENITFREILRKKIEEVNDFDEAIDETLDKLGLSVPSRIFGCTGWKSRIKIEIKDLEEEYINFNNLEFGFPLNKLQQRGRQFDTEFWTKRVLFKDNSDNILKFFKNVKIKLITTDYWWNKYLNDFFEYFKDKLILVGGKNSFGFGFVNLNLDDNQNKLVSFNSIDNLLKIEKITNIVYTERKKVLGFNFKYYLRKKENKRFRKNNFGEQGRSSKVYVSNLLEDNSIYIFLLNNPFLEERGIPQNVFNKYITWLKFLRGDSSNV